MSHENQGRLALAAHRSRARFGMIMLGVVLGGIPIHPQAQGADATNLPPVLPPPDFLVSKTALPDLLLKDKRTNHYMTGFPIIGWDPETEFNYGAAVQWFDNGSSDSPFFRYTPYRRRIAVAAAGSTGGSSRALIGYDQPYIGDTPWRIRGAGYFDRNLFQNYFGSGESTLGPLTYPGSPREFDNYDEYKEALEQNVGGQTWARYNDYDKRRIGGVFTVERDYLGGRLRRNSAFRSRTWT
jgi:hypothetical protein